MNLKIQDSKHNPKNKKKGNFSKPRLITMFEGGQKLSQKQFFFETWTVE